MDKIKRRRTVTRSSFTRTVNTLKEELRKEEINRGILADKIAKLENLMSDLKGLDSEVMDVLLGEDVSQDSINEELECCEEYSDEFITIKRLVYEHLDNVNYEGRSGSDTQNNAPKSKCYKLPKIEIVKFNGERINWLSFWSQFKKVHEDTELEDCDKFHYLLQSMETGTRARELIESYPMTSANYIKAVTALEQRFGKKELLVEVYVRELLKLIVTNVQRKSKLPLFKLYDKVETYLRALDSMGVQQDTNSAWLYPMIESCLSEEVLKAWQRSSVSNSENSENNSRLSRLITFLRNEVEGEERLQLARRGFEEPPSRASPNSRPDGGRVRKAETLTTAAGLFASEGRCSFCNKFHDSKECFTARSLPLRDRITKLKENKCCLKCLRPGHIAKACRYLVRCHLCERSHPVVLCPELPLKKENKGETAEAVQNTVAKEDCSEVALMTLEVEIAGNKVKKKVRALLDCGSQRSYILKSTAAELGLNSISTESITHTLFGGARTEPKEHKKYRIKLNPFSKFRKCNLEFEFIDQDIICGNIPRIPKGPLLK